MSVGVTLKSLKQQSAYKLDVDVRQGEQIFGAFGKKIYEAQWINTHGSPIVLLEMTGEKTNNEAIFNITLDHAHIIKTYGTVGSNTQRINSNSILLLQEYAPDGDLAGRLSRRMFIPSQSVLLEIFIQLSDAMVYLSKNGIIHGDLACRNVLVFKTHPFQPKLNLVKLIDFGLARDSSTASDEEIQVPIRYAAPEIIRSKGRSGYSQKSDVFSFGALMWEACSSGKVPYEDIHEDEVICQQKLNGEKLQRPIKCDPNMWTLMLKCWNNEPEDRPNFQTIYTQLKNIQNTNLPDSNLSSSTVIEENSRLINSEYQTCHECGLRYTDYQSHKNTCSEEELTCYVCQNQFRRAIYDNHMEVCEASSENSSDEVDEDDLLFCQHCNKQYDRHELENHERNCPDNPRNRRPKAILVQLPCEICMQLIDALQFNIHQRECKEKDNDRIDGIRGIIEKKENIREIQCSHCSRNFSVDEINEHEASCPLNVPGIQLALTPTPSVSFSNIRNIPTKAKTLETEKTNRSWNLRKMLSRLCFSRKSND